MFWGKPINPRDYLTPPTPFTVERQKPHELPGDIQVAVAELINAVRADMNEMSYGSVVAVNAADAGLAKLILKHLRGEA